MSTKSYQNWSRYEGYNPTLSTRKSLFDRISKTSTRMSIYDNLGSKKKNFLLKDDKALFILD